VGYEDNSTELQRWWYISMAESKGVKNLPGAMGDILGGGVDCRVVTSKENRGSVKALVVAHYVRPKRPVGSLPT
jgi:hypothetical protein